MNYSDKNYFENKVYCNKNKLKKTLLVCKLDLDKLACVMDQYNILNPNPNPSIVVKKIYLELNTNSDDYGLIESLISKLEIIISTSKNPKSSQHTLIKIPGYICGFRFIEPKLLELDVWFENFLPNGLVFPVHTPELSQIYDPDDIVIGTETETETETEIPVYNYYKKDFYLMILFNNLVKNDLIVLSYLKFELSNTNLDDNEIYLIFEKDCKIFQNQINNFHPTDHFKGHKTIFIQQTHTVNISCFQIDNSKLTVPLKFNFMCRGFWIKMHKMDFENLKYIKLTLNGHDRFNLDSFQLELLELNKKYIDGSVVFFLNLEMVSKNWNLPKTITESKLIYSNSLNLSRIDETIFVFNFESKILTGDHIGISAINANLIGIQNIKYEQVFSN
jgi:hypothetical protein